MRVVDVWETREAYDQYAAEKIGPYSAEAGITEPPETRFYDVTATSLRPSLNSDRG